MVSNLDAKTFGSCWLISYYFLGVWRHDRSVKLTELYHGAHFVKNVLLPHSMEIIFIFDDGYILYVCTLPE